MELKRHRDSARNLVWFDVWHDGEIIHTSEKVEAPLEDDLRSALKDKYDIE